MVSIRKLFIIMSIVSILANPVISVKASAPLTTEDYAIMCDMSYEDFVFISSVTEAESNRSTNGDLSGRILIAETIINRINDPRFPNTASGVLCQSGQFSTVRNGRSVVGNTTYSDQAVYLAIQEINAGEAPNVLFFNCVGYNMSSICTPYDYVGGNYFMTWDA